MSFPKILVIVAVLLFGVIGATAWWKSGAKVKEHQLISSNASVVEIDLDQQIKKVAPEAQAVPQLPAKPITKKTETQTAASTPALPSTPSALAQPTPKTADKDLPTADRIQELFNVGTPKLPIVETVTYSSSVPWLKGKAAWVADYAAYYNTSRHFIARSLNRKPDYFTQKIANGDRFNVFRKDKNIAFHLLIDVPRCKMWFYYIDQDTKERVLLKTYAVGLGRLDPKKTSGTRTPLGKYSLGSKVGIYAPGKMGTYNNEKTEMVRVFGTRWIPFDQELEGCSEPAKGYGIHGVPWVQDSKTGQLTPDASGIGGNQSDGCVRLRTEDIEEVFAIIITKPTTVELVRDFSEAKLPGNLTLNPASEVSK